MGAPAVSKVISSFLLVGFASLGTAVCSQSHLPGARLTAPIFVTRGQVLALARTCSADSIAPSDPIVEILAETNDGLVVWIVASGQPFIHSLPSWISKAGQFFIPPRTERYSETEIIWQRKVPRYKLAWLTSAQVGEVKSILDQQRGPAAGKLGVMILMRTTQGLLIRLQDTNSTKKPGKVLCVTDSGKLVVQDQSLTESHLSWDDTLAKERRR